MTRRASRISTANTAVEALSTSTRTNSRSGAGQPAARAVRSTRERTAAPDGKCDPGAGQNQAKLQIEPWRCDLGADRTRGGMKKIGDVSEVQIHRQISSQGGSASGKH